RSLVLLLPEQRHRSAPIVVRRRDLLPPDCSGAKQYRLSWIGARRVVAGGSEPLERAVLEHLRRGASSELGRGAGRRRQGSAPWVAAGRGAHGEWREWLVRRGGARGGRRRVEGGRWRRWSGRRLAGAAEEGPGGRCARLRG